MAVVDVSVSPELAFVLLLFVVASVPTVVALLALAKRLGGGREAELEELRARVEELESEVESE